MHLNSTIAVIWLLCAVFAVTESEKCEVCVGFLERLYRSLVATHRELSSALVEEELIKACAEATGKENRLCYYLGASSDAAAKVTSEVSRPLSAHVPVQKICQRLQHRDQQICELRYEHQVLDWSREALSKMRVLELKRVLASWGEECRGCLEKTDLIDLIQEVAPSTDQLSLGHIHLNSEGLLVQLRAEDMNCRSERSSSCSSELRTQTYT